MAADGPASRAPTTSPAAAAAGRIDLMSDDVAGPPSSILGDRFTRAVAYAVELHANQVRRSVATDLELVGDDLWSRFNADRDAQAWYCRALQAVFEDGIPTSRDLPEFRDSRCADRGVVGCSAAR